MKIKNFIAILVFVLGLNGLAAEVKVKVIGVYQGRDNTENLPICKSHATQTCIFQTYIVQSGSQFPLGITSATYTNPDSGVEVPFNSVVQVYTSATEFTLLHTPGTGWVGPFSINSNDWAIVLP